MSERSMPPRRRPARSAARAWLVALLVAASVAPATVSPAVARELPAVADPGRAVVRRPAEPPNDAALDPPPDGAMLPSAHYRHAESHAADAIAFEPGGRVTVPFRPRSDDVWPVGGTSPRSLPAGHTTGKAMRQARAGAIWSTGAPRDLAGPAPDATTFLDQPVGEAVGGDLASTTSMSGEDEVASTAVVGRNGLRREVFGFLPYWELSDSSTVLDWRTLSTVAYFSVGCTSSGGLWKRNADGSLSTGWAGWTSSRMTSVINRAHEHGTRVVLTVSCFAWSSAGATVQARLLGSSAARSTLARQVAAAVRDRGADGVNLDFEPIVSGYSDEFTALVRAVRRELNAIAPGYQLTFDAMGSVGSQPIAAATAPGGADAIVIMGYDYRTAGSSVAGSISPLSGPIYDLTDTVRAFTAKVPASKLILGVPYYGRAWSTATSDLHARTLSPAKYGAVAEPSYAQAVKLAASYGRRYDRVEQAPWAAYRRQTCTAAYGCVTSWRQMYYDDAASLRLRYDLVNRAGLRGAGIWALGYDDSRPELRAALADRFRGDRAPPRAGVATLPPRVHNEGFRVAWGGRDGSRIARYDVQVSVDGGSWSRWLTGVTATSSVYLGRNGHRYAFRVRATDVHSNVSAWRAIPLRALTAPPGLGRGAFGTVVTNGLRLRAAPDTGAAVIRRLPAGAVLHVVGGPVIADRYAWFRVVGPVMYWGPLETKPSGWVAAFGRGVTNVRPRAPVYATTVSAAIVGLRIGAGGTRLVTPNGDGVQDSVRVDWTNARSFDRLTLRIFRLDGSLAGTVPLRDRGRGPASFRWNGKIAGVPVAKNAYVLQLRGVAGGRTYSSPSASPVSRAQALRYGVVVAPRPSTGVTFGAPVTPRIAGDFTYRLSFGAPVTGLTLRDIARAGTARGCALSRLAGGGASWTVRVTGCRPGTFRIAVAAGTVVDAVGNWGPTTRQVSPVVVIDQTRPTATALQARLRTGVRLASPSADARTLVALSWRGRDTGGAGVASFDVARSVDGARFRIIAEGIRGRSLAVKLARGHSYRFEVRARDRAGNIGPWHVGPTLRPARLQESARALEWRGIWRPASGTELSGRGSRYALGVGAHVRYTFTGRSIAWVTTRSPGRGQVRVYVDGSFVTTVDTSAASPRYRVVAFSRSWATVRTHTLRLVVVGTPRRPRVDVDAFEILR